LYDVAAFPEVDETVTVPEAASSWHEIKFAIDGKNASSGGYTLMFSDFVLYPF